MQNDTINPIHHSLLSKASGTTLGAVGGGIKGGAKGWAYTALAFAAIGAVVASGGTVLGLLGVGSAVTSTIGTLLGQAALGGLAGGLVGGFVVGPVVGGVNTWLGAFKGGSNAAARIRSEQGAANMVDAQLSAYQAQAYAAAAAPTTVYAPSAANNNYPTASTMNQAGTKIQADSAQDLGTVNGMQLQRA